MCFRCKSSKSGETKNKKLISKKISVPLSTLLLFMTTVVYWNNQNYGLALEYEGQEIATISNEKVYEEAENLIRSQITPQEKSKMEKVNTKIKLTTVNKEECCKHPEVVKEKIIEKSNDIVNSAWGVYIEGKLIAVGESEESIHTVLNQILEESQSNYKDKNAIAEFEDKIEIKKGIFSSEKICDSKKLKDILCSSKQKTTNYTVTENDSVVSIAEKFGMQPAALLGLNNKTNKDSICCGDKLQVLVTEDLLHIKVVCTENQINKLPFETIETQDPDSKKGTQITVQEGVDGEECVKYEVQYQNGREIDRKQLSSEITLKPISKIISIGTKQEEYIWPVPFTKNITSYFGPRDGGYHYGIDIAWPGVYKKEIVAAKAGAIEKVSKGNRGYGNHLIIQHHDGTQTLYAHCESISVKEKQEVGQGDVIAKVGSTGQSTGPHLHFEIRVNKIRQDPLKFIK